MQLLTSAKRQHEENVLSMPLEHVTFMPPVGMWTGAEIRQCDDGHFELMQTGCLSEEIATVDLSILTASSFKENDETLPKVSVLYDPLNLSPSAVETLQASVPSNFVLTAKERNGVENYAEIILSLDFTGLAVVTATLFAGGLLSQMGKLTAEKLW